MLPFARAITLAVTTAGVAAAVLGTSPASAASAGLHLQLVKQGKGAKIAWTNGTDQHLHMESATESTVRGAVQWIDPSPAEAVGAITYTMESACADGFVVFVRLMTPERGYGRDFPCDPAVPVGAVQTADPRPWIQSLISSGAQNLSISGVHFTLRKGGVAKIDDMTIPYAGGIAVFHDSASAASR
jgi:hypothetical protein